MIIDKREKFRLSLRKQQLENQFKINRFNSTNSSLKQFEMNLNNSNYDAKLFELAMQKIDQEDDEELIIAALRYIEKFYSCNISLNLPSLLCKALKKTQSSVLQFYLIISITNILSIQNFDIFNLFINEELIMLTSEIISKFLEPDIYPELFQCIADWPYEFYKMNTTNNQIELLKTLRLFSFHSKESYYKYLTKITEEIGNEEELTDFILKNQIFQESIDDFKQGHLFIIEFFINLSFLEAEIIEKIICIEFLSVIIFELNKSNKIQQQLYLLIRNLLLSNYSIRMCFYNFAIFNHLAYGIDFCNRNFDFQTLEEILTCLKILFQEEEMTYQNHKKQILCTDIEEMLQNIFQFFSQQKNILILAGEVIFMYYMHFPYNNSQQFKYLLINTHQKFGLEIIESIISYIDQYK